MPLADGTRLSGRVWRPADGGPVPAILEYLPYRKSDSPPSTTRCGIPTSPATATPRVRVDIRGSGDSEGVLEDEYQPQERRDALELLEWIADQEWCDGSIGMMGISWGGFNSLQIAAHRPPQLKAIITACSTDDRYADDVHYVGGTVLGYYMLPWASVMLAFNSRPPDPQVVGERWREMWHQRLEANSFLAERWLTHQRRDEYWKQGSVCEDFAAIQIPVYLVGGWSDGYTSAIFRMLDGLQSPRRAVIGPWEHVWPEEGVPGPQIGFLQEAVRWWDHWLKGRDTGIMDEPLVRAYVQDSEPPRPAYDDPPRALGGRGRLAHAKRVADDLSPDRRRTQHRRRVSTGHDSPTARLRRSGLDAGSWLPYANPADLPGDQRQDNSRSLTFTSEPLAEPLQLLGPAQAVLTLSSSEPQGFVAVRLCDVRPDGSVALVARGILNLAHRESHEHPVPLTPGEAATFTVPLKPNAYTVPAGHRLELAISTSYWPWVWPSPRPVQITLDTGAVNTVTVPVRTPQPGDGAEPFGPAETAPPLQTEVLHDRDPHVRITRDVASGRVEYRMSRSLWGSRRLPSGLEYRDADPVLFSITDDDPLSARAEARRSIEIGRDEWRTRIEVVTQMTATAEHFLLSATLEVYEGEERVFERAYVSEIPRDDRC